MDKKLKLQAPKGNYDITRKLLIMGPTRNYSNDRSYHPSRKLLNYEDTWADDHLREDYKPSSRVTKSRYHRLWAIKHNDNLTGNLLPDRYPQLGTVTEFSSLWRTWKTQNGLGKLEFTSN